MSERDATNKDTRERGGVEGRYVSKYAYVGCCCCLGDYEGWRLSVNCLGYGVWLGGALRGRAPWAVLPA